MLTSVVRVRENLVGGSGVGSGQWAGAGVGGRGQGTGAGGGSPGLRRGLQPVVIEGWLLHRTIFIFVIKFK